MMDEGASADLCYQGKLVRVDPDDAEVGVVGVVSRHLLQELQELVTVCARVQEKEQNASVPDPDWCKDKPGSSSSAKATMCSPSMSSS